MPFGYVVVGNAHRAGRKAKTTRHARHYETWRIRRKRRGLFLLKFVTSNLRGGMRAANYEMCMSLLSSSAHRSICMGQCSIARKVAIISVFLRLEGGKIKLQKSEAMKFHICFSSDEVKYAGLIAVEAHRCRRWML